MMKVTSLRFATRQDQWRFLGEHFGYPPCCVEAFINGQNWKHVKCTFPRIAAVIQALHYIPCNACIAAYYSGRSFIASANSHYCDCFDFTNEELD